MGMYKGNYGVRIEDNMPGSIAIYRTRHGKDVAGKQIFLTGVFSEAELAASVLLMLDLRDDNNVEEDNSPNAGYPKCLERVEQ